MSADMWADPETYQNHGGAGTEPGESRQQPREAEQESGEQSTHIIRALIRTLTAALTAALTSSGHSSRSPGRPQQSQSDRAAVDG